MEQSATINGVVLCLNTANHRKITKFANDMGIDTLQAAKTYGEKIGLKSIREAGTKDGWHYYHVFRKLPNGHKTGLPKS